MPGRSKAKIPLPVLRDDAQRDRDIQHMIETAAFPQRITPEDVIRRIQHMSGALIAANKIDSSSDPRERRKAYKQALTAIANFFLSIGLREIHGNEIINVLVHIIMDCDDTERGLPAAAWQIDENRERVSHRRKDEAVRTFPMWIALAHLAGAVEWCQRIRFGNETKYKKAAEAVYADLGTRLPQFPWHGLLGGRTRSKANIVKRLVSNHAEIRALTQNHGLEPESPEHVARMLFLDNIRRCESAFECEWTDAPTGAEPPANFFYKLFLSATAPLISRAVPQKFFHTASD